MYFCSSFFPSFSTSSSFATTPLSRRHQHVDFDECENESERKAEVVGPATARGRSRNLMTSPSSSSAYSFFLVSFLLLVSTLNSVFPSISAARLLELENNNNNGDVWPMNIDGLFAAEQLGDNIKPVSPLLTSSSSSSEFDFFSPLSVSQDSLAMAPDFNVMSSTSPGAGPQVGWQPSSPTYYQVVQGNTINITSTLQVSDSAGVVVIPTYVGIVVVSITVPASMGTLSLTPVSNLSFATSSSGVSNITITGNFAIVQKSLNSTLQFTAATTASVGNTTLTFAVTLAGISTKFTPSLIVNVQATPTTAPTTVSPTTAPTTVSPTTALTTVSPTTAPTTVSPTTAPTTVSPTTAPTTVSTTTALPTPAVTSVRIQFSLGRNLTSISINSRAWTTQQQHRQPAQVGHRFGALATVLRVGTTEFNTHLALDICNVTGIAAQYCSQRVKVDDTFIQNGETFAVVDFLALNTTGSSITNSSAGSIGPTSAQQLAQAFTSSSSSWSSVPSLQSASVSTISFYCSYTGTFSSADSCTAPSSSSSSGDPWWIPLVVILPFFFVLAIVIIAYLLVRKRRQQQQPTNTKKVEVELANRDKAAPITTSSPPTAATTAAAASSTPPPAVQPVPTTSSREEATTSSPVAVAVPVQGGQYAVVEPGLKFMYSAPDWEPEEAADSASGGGPSARQDVHVHLDPSFDPAGTASPPRTMEEDNASRFSYVPKEL